MEITLALQSPRQVGEACLTEAGYVRIGYPYCSLMAKKIWPIDEIDRSVSTILSSGKIPQLTLPFCPLENKEEKYWRRNINLLKKFPQMETVVSSWGSVELPLVNTKIASVHLNAFCSQEVDLLHKQGVRVVALPLNIRDGKTIRKLIKNSFGVEFEYPLDGRVLTSFNWYCDVGAGKLAEDNCVNAKAYINFQDESLPGMQSKGNTIWLDHRMVTLQQARDLSYWGVNRGVITWGDYDLKPLQELIALYKKVLIEGINAISDDEFYQELRKQVRSNYLN